jgi:HlyD family secretion protein
MELRVSGSFIVMPKHNADVRAEVEGIIEKIEVGEGDHVEKGGVLAQLSNHDYNAELNKTIAEIEANKARLKLLVSGTRPEEIQLARVQLSKAEELLVFADAHAQRDKYQMERKLISEQEYEKSRELAAMRNRELHEAQERLNILLAGSRPEEIDAIKADIRSLEARERHLQKQLQSLLIVSPISGVVTTHKLKEKVGENLKKGDLFAEVYELKTVMVEIAVPEKEIGDVKVGQEVALKARAYPGNTFEGKVKSIAPVVTKPSEWELQRTVIVITELDNSHGLLKPEMTGNARIYCGQRRMLDLLTRRLVRYLRVEFWSWW